MENLNLSKEEALRLEIAERLGYDVKKAKPVCDFVLGKEDGQNTFAVETAPIYPDGTYYVLSDKSLIKADTENAKSFSDSIVGVAVKMGEKIATVALHDAADGEDIALASGECGSAPFFHNNFIDAISDWNGEGNTKDYGDALNPAIGLKDGQYIPSLGQLYFILLNIKAVNAALEAVGGSPLQKNWYWSSTEGSTFNSWSMIFIDGYAYGSIYKFTTHVVRPSVAYRL